MHTHQDEGHCSPYRALYETVSGHIHSYRTDLEVHDRACMDANPGVPFLHYTNGTGTVLNLLRPAEGYPARGETIPFLFGTADREHLLDSVVSMAGYFLKQTTRPPEVVIHFDGHSLRRVTVQEAVEIAKHYAWAIRGTWNDQREAEECTKDRQYEPMDYGLHVDEANPGAF